MVFYEMVKFDTPLRKVEMPDQSSLGINIFVSTKDFGEFVDFNDLHENMLRVGDIKRTDQTLIDIIEMLGSSASAPFSKLKIVEIPDDVEWEIEEYDGWEHIAEKTSHMGIRTNADLVVKKWISIKYQNAISANTSLTASRTAVEHRLIHLSLRYSCGR